MIGAAEGGRAVLGVVVCPALGRTFMGACEPAEFGALEIQPDGLTRPIRTSPLASVAEARVVISRSHQPPEARAKLASVGVRAITPVGSAGVKAALVACGEADLYVHPGRAGKRWDTCAPEAIVRAAGGRATDLEGAAIDYTSGEIPNVRGLVMSNGALHDAALAAFRS
jgi:3'(2'), 5'-bisphosphate nucleotidase